MTGEQQGTGVVELYLDAAGEWRWRRIARNGRIVATSAEGYHNLADAQESMLLACTGLADTRIVQLADGEAQTPDEDTPPSGTRG